MSEDHQKNSLRRAVTTRIKQYRQNANRLGKEVQQRVFGSRLAPDSATNEASLVDKLQAHRLLERRRAFRRAGGQRSSLVRYGLKKARLKR